MSNELLFQFRGKSYPILSEAYSDTYGIKLQSAIDNRFASPTDDALAAYVISKLCPQLAAERPELVSYKSQTEFNWSLNITEAIAFTALLGNVILNNLPGDENQRVILNKKAAELRNISSTVVEESQQLILKSLTEEPQQEILASQATVTIDVKPDIETENTPTLVSPEVEKTALLKRLAELNSVS